MPEAFGRGAIDVAHFNMACTGGLTEGRKLAALADNFERAIVPHDCTGPGLLVANTHQVFAAENALILRTVRAHDRRYCCGPVTRAAADRARLACPMDGAGLGATLRPELRSRSDVAIRRSSS